MSETLETIKTLFRVVVAFASVGFVMLVLLFSILYLSNIINAIGGFYGIIVFFIAFPIVFGTVIFIWLTFMGILFS